VLSQYAGCDSPEQPTVGLSRKTFWAGIFGRVRIYFVPRKRRHCAGGSALLRSGLAYRGFHTRLRAIKDCSGVLMPVFFLKSFETASAITLV